MPSSSKVRPIFYHSNLIFSRPFPSHRELFTIRTITKAALFSDEQIALNSLLNSTLSTKERNKSGTLESYCLKGPHANHFFHYVPFVTFPCKLKRVAQDKGRVAPPFPVYEAKRETNIFDFRYRHSHYCLWCNYTYRYTTVFLFKMMCL